MTPDPSLQPTGRVPPPVHGTAINEALLLSSLREYERRESAELLSAERARLLDVARLATLGAEKANSAKDYFLATLSHELRTPLNPALLLASDGARNLAWPPEARRDFAAIEKNITLEARLIDELLEYTRTARGKIVLRRDSVSINAILQDAASNVQADFVAQGLRLEVEYCRGNPLLRGDAVRLQQVFWNLLKNASKFTPAGGRVRLEAALSPTGDNLVVRCADSGIGIPPAELEHIFEAFNQVERAETAPAGRRSGLGLGLAIAKSIVDLHSGRIWAESLGAGLGSVFAVELPRDADTPALREDPIHEVVTAAAEKPPAPRLLLLDEDENVRSALQRILAVRGFHVFAVGSVAEALALGARLQFDVLLANSVTAGDDRATLEILAKTSPAIRGIAVSSHNSPDERALTRAAGFYIHLVKPVGAAELERGLWAALGSDPPFASAPPRAALQS